MLKTDAAPLRPLQTLPDATDRVAAARARHGQLIADRCNAAGIAYPAGEVFLRAFKYEGELELWAKSICAGDVPFRLVTVYPIQRASGNLGPKRREGDRMVPEGCYMIDRFNSKSAFHLSLGLDYPNVSDRQLTSDFGNPGSNVFIHGGAESMGCLAMGDPVIEEIFLATSDARAAGQGDIFVHIFPCRMSPENITRILAPAAEGNQKLEAFWRNLLPVHDYFQQKHRLPRVGVTLNGFYRVL